MDLHMKRNHGMMSLRPGIAVPPKFDIDFFFKWDGGTVDCGEKSLRASHDSEVRSIFLWGAFGGGGGVQVTPSS